MAFEPSDFEDLVRFLDAHPDMRDQLRRRILSDEFLRLPLDVEALGGGMAELRLAIEKLAVAEERTEARLEMLATAQERTEARIETLATAQERTEARIETLATAQERTEARIERLAAAQERTEARIERLAAAQERTEQTLSVLTLRVDALAESQRSTEVSIRLLAQRTGANQGHLLEWRFRERAPSYFGTILKRPRLVEVDDLDLVDAALDAGGLSERDVDSLRWLDAIVRGKDKREPGFPETLLALEVSVTIDTEDVTRARDRAGVLRAAGYRAFGVVGGEQITGRAEELAGRDGVLVRLATPDGERKEQTA